MGFSKFRMVLKGFDNAYYPGSSIIGSVLFTTDSLLEIRGLRIEFLGKASTLWLDKQPMLINGRWETRDIPWCSTQILFEQTYYIIGGPQETVTLDPDDHVYNFNTTLPLQLPSSFESEYGHVRYSVEVILDAPWSINRTITKDFTVRTRLDLNTYEKAKEPVRHVVEKSFGCCCWSYGRRLTIVINMPHSAYVPGHTIPLMLEVDNGSDVRVDNIIISLVKDTTWTANYHIKQETVNISELRLDGVEPHCSRTSRYRLKVPKIQLYDLDHCSIIKRKYYLKVVGEISGYHTNLNEKLPILLGNVPYHPNFKPSPFPALQTSSKAPPLSYGSCETTI